MFTFIYTQDTSKCITDVSAKLVSYLNADKKILWLIPGGSNIVSAVEILNMIKKQVDTNRLHNLVVTLTDERYGPVGHVDSNWKQLIIAGFDTDSVQAIPVLTGVSFKETVYNYDKNIKVAMKDSDVIVGLFGMGSDGHIAGVLPNTIGVISKDLACGYISDKFTRITLTLNMLKEIHVAYLFAFGKSKRGPLNDLKNKNISLNEQPAQVLKLVAESLVYQDQLPEVKPRTNTDI